MDFHGCRCHLISRFDHQKLSREIEIGKYLEIVGGVFFFLKVLVFKSIDWNDYPVKSVHYSMIGNAHSKKRQKKSKILQKDSDKLNTVTKSRKICRWKGKNLQIATIQKKKALILYLLFDEHELCYLTGDHKDISFDFPQDSWAHFSWDMVIHLQLCWVSIFIKNRLMFSFFFCVFVTDCDHRPPSHAHLPPSPSSDPVVVVVVSLPIANWGNNLSTFVNDRAAH